MTAMSNGWLSLQSALQGKIVIITFQDHLSEK